MRQLCFGLITLLTLSLFSWIMISSAFSWEDIDLIFANVPPPIFPHVYFYPATSLRGNASDTIYRLSNIFLSLVCVFGGQRYISIMTTTAQLTTLCVYLVNGIKCSKFCLCFLGFSTFTFMRRNRSKAGLKNSKYRVQHMLWASDNPLCLAADSCCPLCMCVL